MSYWRIGSLSPADRARAVVVRVAPEPETRTPENNCVFRAECEVGGAHYVARTRTGAANALARLLVAAGVPDGPMVVLHEGVAGEMSYQSFHDAAVWTFTEGDKPLQRARWTDPATRFGAIATAKQAPDCRGATSIADNALSPANRACSAAKIDPGAVPEPAPAMRRRDAA